MPKPCATSHPRPRSRSSVAPSSTPSATTCEPEPVPELDGRADDRVVGGVAVEPGDEAAVDLQRDHGQPLEVGERRVPGAEVVDAQGDAEPRQPLEHRQAVRRVVHRGRLGDLELEPAGRRRARLQLGDLVDDARVQRARRQVHRDRDPQPGAGPRRLIGHRGAQHPERQRPDQPGALREPDERVRRDEPVARPPPAHERLDAGDRARAQVELGLVVQDELARGDRAAQPRRQRDAVGGVDAHRRLVHRPSARAAPSPRAARRRPGAAASRRPRRAPRAMPATARTSIASPATATGGSSAASARATTASARRRVADQREGVAADAGDALAAAGGVHRGARRRRAARCPRRGGRARR